MAPDADRHPPLADADHELVEAAWRQYQGIPTSAGVGRGHAGARSAPPAMPADAFSGYRILGEIHRGGQGVVYQALQESTRRKVAIKVLKEGPLADAVERARFEREVDALSRLKHPNIVTIHDRGQAGGYSYLVMDYVAGDALDDYLADNIFDTTLEGRLALFVKICDAVNAAHVRGVIHRDLKPGNIRIDEEGEPRVLDFGLAKFELGGGVAGALGRSRNLTESGQFVGSLPWASPEQAAGRSDLIDTRTDVYALGVILYQMLTGDFPYSVVASLPDVLNNILHVEPIRPRTIQSALDDEIETIVLKCLAKEPERRYQSAGELSRDVGRYLAGEPIEAKRDSHWYVLRKSLRRHRTAAVFSGVLLVSMMASAVVMFVLYREAEHARRQTAAQQVKAEGQAARATRIQEFLAEMLSAVDPGSAGDEETRLLRQMMDDAAGRIERELKGEPEAQASIHATIGAVYKQLGRYEEAETHLGAALGLAESLYEPGGPEVADACFELGDVRFLRGDVTGAEALASRALAHYRAAGVDAQQFAVVLQLTARVRQALGDSDAALGHFREALAMLERLLGPEHERVGHILSDLGSLLDDLGRLDEAEVYLRRALEISRHQLGDDHARIAEILHLLGITLGKRGKLDECGRCIERSIEIQRRVYGPDHPSLAQAMTSLGTLRLIQNAPSDAERLYRDSLRISRLKLGDDHDITLGVLGNLAESLSRQGKHAAAQPLLAELLERLNRRGDEHAPEIVKCRARLGGTLVTLQRYTEAEPILLEAYSSAGRWPEQMERMRATIAGRLIDLYEATGAHARAAEWRARLPAASQPATARS